MFLDTLTHVIEKQISLQHISLALSTDKIRDFFAVLTRTGLLDKMIGYKVFQRTTESSI